MTQPPCKRILLKISGESLLGAQTAGISVEATQKLADVLMRIHAEQFEVAVVIGGGNIFRGLQLKELGMARSHADQIGMLATMMNGLALKQALEMRGADVHLISGLECPAVAERFQLSRSGKALQEGSFLICVGGTGHPYFTTDTAAALRASELRVDLLIKATKVRGVFNRDPVKFPDAIFYPEVSYEKVLADRLGIMDATAISMCQSNRVPVFVCSLERLFAAPLRELLARKEGTFIVGE